MSEEEKAIQTCRDFLHSLQPSRGTLVADYCLVRKEGVSRYRGSACHSAYSTTTSFLPIAVCSALLVPDSDIELAKEFWKWVSGSKSPWRKIFETNNIELVTSNNGNPLGWILYGEGLVTIPWNFHKQFAILCRTVTEKINHWKLWYKLVTENKVDPTDAFYLISLFVLENSQIVERRQTCGAHWALTESKDYRGSLHSPIDWKIFKTGNVDFKRSHAPPINGWFNQKTGLTPFDPKMVVTKSINPGKFVPMVNVYDLNDVLDAFYKWKDNEGILNV